jgi:hypothetical protein
MTPRESDPTGAFSDGGSAGLEEEERQEADHDPARPRNPAESVTPGVDEAEREIVTGGVAQTSEVADREAREDAERKGDGTPLPD